MRTFYSLLMRANLSTYATSVMSWANSPVDCIIIYKCVFVSTNNLNPNTCTRKLCCMTYSFVMGTSCFLITSKAADVFYAFLIHSIQHNQLVAKIFISPFPQVFSFFFCSRNHQSCFISFPFRRVSWGSYFLSLARWFVIKTSLHLS